MKNRPVFMGTIPSCNFFATPTRLADGLGTKEYPLDTFVD